MKQAELYQEIRAIGEQSYDRLEGEWHDWLEVARQYEHKVPSQDRQDIRHDILIELAHARARDCKPIPILRAYRIATLMVALYWRERIKREVKVCVKSGLAVEPKCSTCRHRPKGTRCAWLAIRPLQSLDQPITDYDGNEARLLDTIADDNALDALDIGNAIDASRCLLGCPMRLIEIATKRRDGIPLNRKEQTYLNHYQARHLKKSQIALF